MGVEAERQRELRELIAQSDAIIAEHGEAFEDPVLADRVAAAHFDRASALGLLERHQESLEAWDRFLKLWAQTHPAASGGRRFRLASALTLKRQCLWVLDQREEASLLDVEIAERFADDPGAPMRWLVSVALARRAGRLMNHPDRLTEALAVSDELIGRFRDDPEDTLEDQAALLLSHARRLLAVYPIGFASVVGGTAEALLNAGIATVGSLSSRLNATLEVPGLEELARLPGRLTPPMLARHRRREAQSLAVIDAVLGRLTGRDEPELAAVAMRARILAGAAKAMSGHPREGFNAIGEVQATRDPSAVRAFADFAAEESQRPGWISQIATAAFLNQRADSLVGDDPKLARLAYDDSVAAQLPADLSLPVKLMVRFLRPRLPRDARERP